MNVNIQLSSDDAQNVDGRHVFDLHQSINLVGKRGILNLTDFQALNSIFNVTSNDTFMGETFNAGFYDVTNLKRLLKVGNPFSVEFNTSTLSWTISSLSPFTLTGSIVSYLGFTKTESVWDGLQYSITSERAFDLYRRAHNVHVICSNLKHSSNVVAQHHLNERVAKVPINVDFGDYIVHHSGDAARCVLYENRIDRMEILLLNDLGERVLMNERYNLTFRLTIEDLDVDPWLDELEAPKRGVVGGAFYPIIRREVGHLKSARERALLLVKSIRKNALKDLGYDDDEIDVIEMKHQAILKKLKKNVKE